jgi:hypothetical protein
MRAHGRKPFQGVKTYCIYKYTVPETGSRERLGWFATEKAVEQMSDLGDCKPVKDTIYFGLVQASRKSGLFLSRGDRELQTQDMGN